MQYQYKTSGKVCSSRIDLEIDDTGTVRNVHFLGGCAGNTQGVALLVEGMPAQEVMRRLGGVRCGSRGSSCPAELAEAVKQALAERAAQAQDKAEKGQQAG